MIRSGWRHGLRLLVSVGLFVAVLSQVDWSGVKQVLAQMSGVWLAIHLLVLALERLVFTYKWRVLLIAQGASVPLWNLLVITLVGKFWGMFLPSSVGVDIVRAYYLYRYTASGTLAASSVLVDKVLSLWALLVLGTVGLLLYGTVFEGVQIGLYLAAAIGLTAAALYLLLRPDFARWMKGVLPRLLGARLGDMAWRGYQAFLAYRRHPRTLGYCFGLSLTMQLVRVLAVYAMARALGIEIPPIYYFVLIPISMILIMLPISIGGLGLREGIFVALFALAGMSTTDAFALGFATSITDLLVSLLGGVVYWFVRIPKAASGPSPER